MKAKVRHGFTIVELLVAIVVIGILANIIIISYSGISQKAVEVSLKSDLINSSKQLKMYQVVHGTYPTALDNNNCPLAPFIDNAYCLKLSTNNSIYCYESDGTKFALTKKNKNETFYHITDSKTPTSGKYYNLTDWIAIGNQIWAKKNLDIGNKLSSATNQTNNNVIEKYCYYDLDSNCISFGGLYKWDEAMGYVNSEASKGICSDCSHIPTDNEWKILEMYLGMTQAQADGISYRGSNQGTKLKLGGISKLDLVLGGCSPTNIALCMSNYGSYWSSTINLTNTNEAFYRSIYSAVSTVYRRYTPRNYLAFSVRCLKN